MAYVTYKCAVALVKNTALNLKIFQYGNL